ncbi:hypothetical protein PENTCL1PPCAC_4713, partial [Pristionchus entomophagus]
VKARYKFKSINKHFVDRLEHFFESCSHIEHLEIDSDCAQQLALLRKSLGDVIVHELSIMRFHGDNKEVSVNFTSEILETLRAGQIRRLVLLVRYVEAIPQQFLLD